MKSVSWKHGSGIVIELSSCIKITFSIFFLKLLVCTVHKQEVAFAKVLLETVGATTVNDLL